MLSHETMNNSSAAGDSSSRTGRSKIKRFFSSFTNFLSKISSKRDEDESKNGDDDIVRVELVEDGELLQGHNDSDHRVSTTHVNH